MFTTVDDLNENITSGTTKVNSIIQIHNWIMSDFPNKWEKHFFNLTQIYIELSHSHTRK